MSTNKKINLDKSRTVNNSVYKKKEKQSNNTSIHRHTIEQASTKTGADKHYTDRHETTNSVYSFQSQNHTREAVYENTYRLEPDQEDKFDHEKIEKQTRQILEEHLQDVAYNPSLCRQLSMNLVTQILERLKESKIPRYKLIAIVTIGDIDEKPSVFLASRCLWNKMTDTFATANYSNLSLYCVATIFGVYYE